LFNWHAKILFELDVSFLDDRTDNRSAQIDRNTIGLFVIEGLHYAFAGGHLALIQAKISSVDGFEDVKPKDFLWLENLPHEGHEARVDRRDVREFSGSIRFLRYQSLSNTIGSNRGRIKHIFRGLPFFILLISLIGCQPRADSSIIATTTSSPSVTILGYHEYAVHQQVVLVNEGSGQPEKQNIWIALIRDFPPYQNVSSMEISPDNYKLVVDEYGNHYAEFDFSNQPAGTTQMVKIDYQVVVNEISYDLSACQGQMLDSFLQPELHIESVNPQIIALAGELSQGKSNICEQVRAFYDYIGNKLTYTFNGENWGAQAALGPMGADCTEYADLLAALSRAQGIPARYFEGLLYLDKGTSDIAKIQHAWPDVYLPGVGWTALDPTLGRAMVNRDTYFAHNTPDHIIVTMGASPSVLRGSSYWTHLYWPGDSTQIRVNGEWKIELVKEGH
jgi:transglutaminase-like putative cysteine protease